MGKYLKNASVLPVKKKRRKPGRYATEFVEIVNIVFNSAEHSFEWDANLYAVHNRNCILQLLQQAEFITYKPTKEQYVYRISLSLISKNQLKT